MNDETSCSHLVITSKDGIYTCVNCGAEVEPLPEPCWHMVIGVSEAGGRCGQCGKMLWGPNEEPDWNIIFGGGEIPVKDKVSLFTYQPTDTDG